jgi:hypothetical protein
MVTTPALRLALHPCLDLVSGMIAAGEPACDALW